MAQSTLQLDDGSRVGVIGGGPAGSFFSFFLLGLAKRLALDIHVDIYEPRDFTRIGPAGCNMCGGIISESLVQMLATEGINLPPTVVQRGIDSYMLHMDVGSVEIETPLHEKRIGAVYRGPGPRDIKEIKWGSFDAYLQKLAVESGANVISQRVTEIVWDDGKPQLRTRKGEPQGYDLLVMGVGVNAAARKLLGNLDFAYVPPKTTKTFIQEYHLGEEAISEVLGSSMHVFLLDIPRLEFAAIIPKGDYVSVCLLGDDIDNELVQEFMGSAEVRGCFPPEMNLNATSCHCSPRISVSGARHPYGDRMVFIGDCGVTRLYKDGIGAAYRTAKAAATTAALHGISAEDFEHHYWPACRKIESDNMIGKLVFFVTRQIQRRRFARRAVLRMTTDEQSKPASRRRLSMVLWDTFTGSAPYRDILRRTLSPAFLGRLLTEMVIALTRRQIRYSDNKQQLRRL